MPTVDERLKTLHITLPEVWRPDALFIPFVRTGNLVYVSGHIAKKEGKPWTGKLGENITTAEGKQAARSIALELLAGLKAAAEDLDRIKTIVRLTVLVNGTPQFTEPHLVANGASEVFLEILGERGAHTRTACSVAQLPFGCCVEIDMTAEIF